MSVFGDFEIRAIDATSNIRLDSFIAAHIKDCSRNQAATLIRQGLIRVSGSIKKPGYQVKSGDLVQGTIPPPAPVDILPESIQFPILFEDPSLIAVNKPPGLVVHPAPGHGNGTLVNGLLYHCPDLAGIGGQVRPGIVHRLDKDTSGILIVAKNHAAHVNLSAQFKSRKIDKIYLALVAGSPTSDKGEIDLPIGRHPTDRKKFSIVSHRLRHAVTCWEVKERFDGLTLLELKILTGRTHQIRVHCAAMHHPLIGDPVYGPRKIEQQVGKEVWNVIRTTSRQMLHAFQLTFIHPVTEESLSLQAPIAEDMQLVLEKLRLLHK